MDITEKIIQAVQSAKSEADQRNALNSINPSELEQYSYDTISIHGDEKKFTDGLLPGAPGVAHGFAAFTTEQAEQLLQEGKKVIFIRNETSAEDTTIMKKCAGVITLQGGRTSHAVIICRGAGLPHVGGNDKLEILSNKGKEADEQTGDPVALVYGNGRIEPKQEISIDGHNGTIYFGEVSRKLLVPPPELDTLLEWADKFSSLETRVILDSVSDIEKAIKRGAKGVSILRTEHMFFEGDRTPIFQQLIMTPLSDKTDRDELLGKMEKFQTEDFTNILSASVKSQDPLPINIRLLDPPFHEFFPRKENWVKFIKQTGNKYTIADLEIAEKRLHEANPMMGLRGNRLLLANPDIMEMQVRAIFEAAVAVYKQTNKKPDVSICLPMIETAEQVDASKTIIKKVYENILNKHGFSPKEIPYKMSAMIETPAACYDADRIATRVDSFSFGTHDLTAFVHGIDRDSSANLEPFIDLTSQTFEAVKQGALKGKKANPALICGICGDQGKSAKSLDMILKKIPDLDYVTAIPDDIYKTRLLTAQKSMSINHNHVVSRIRYHSLSEGSNVRL